MASGAPLLAFRLIDLDRCPWKATGQTWKVLELFLGCTVARVKKKHPPVNLEMNDGYSSNSA